MSNAENARRRLFAADHIRIDGAPTSDHDLADRVASAVPARVTWGA